MNDNVLSIIGGEETILIFLESCIPSFKKMLLDEIDRHTKEQGGRYHIIYGIKIKQGHLLTLNLIKKTYETEGSVRICKNIILAEMLAFNRILVPSFFDEIEKFNKTFEDQGHKNLTLEIIKYIDAKKNNEVVLVVALTPQNENGFCGKPIKVIPIDIFISMILNAKRNSKK